MALDLPSFGFRDVEGNSRHSGPEPAAILFLVNQQTDIIINQLFEIPIHFGDSGTELQKIPFLVMLQILDQFLDILNDFPANPEVKPYLQISQEMNNGQVDEPVAVLLLLFLLFLLFLNQIANYIPVPEPFLEDHNHLPQAIGVVVV